MLNSRTGPLLILAFMGLSCTAEECRSDQLTRITVFPKERTMTVNNRQQLAVSGHFADSVTRDITQKCVFTSTDSNILGVQPNGIVSTFGRSGCAGVIVRFKNKAVLFTATVVPRQQQSKFSFPHKTIIDRLLHEQWQRLGLKPSKQCDDETFLRRVTVHLHGLLPAPEQIKEFLDSKNPNKRNERIDRLLQSPDFAVHFANIWAKSLGYRPATNNQEKYQRFVFYDWLRKSFHKNRPIDQMVKELLTATGTVSDTPAVGWYLHMPNPYGLAEVTSRHFLGIDINCVRCHAHPYEEWTPANYHGMAAFFGKLDNKLSTIPPHLVTLYPIRIHKVYHRPDKKNTVFAHLDNYKPQWPDGPPIDDESTMDPRRQLLKWMLSKNNIYFARNIVNQTWFHFFHRGIVHPVDELHSTNPPANSKLLNALASDFVAHNYSLKHLIKTICSSQSYQLCSEENESNALDDQQFSRFYPRPLNRVMLTEAIAQITNSKPRIPSLPNDLAYLVRQVPYRGDLLYPLGSGMKQIRNAGVCQEESIQHPPIANDLSMYLDGKLLAGKLLPSNGRAALLAKDSRPDRRKIIEVFLWTIGRHPTEAQLDGALAFIEGKDSSNTAYAQLFVALLQTREFLLIR